MGANTLIDPPVSDPGWLEEIENKFKGLKRKFDEVLRRAEPKYRIRGNFGNAGGGTIPGYEVGVDVSNLNLIIDTVDGRDSFLMKLKGIGPTVGLGFNPVNVSYSERSHQSSGTALYCNPLKPNARSIPLMDYKCAWAMQISLTFSLTGDTRGSGTGTNSGSAMAMLFYSSGSDLAQDISGLTHERALPIRWIACGATWGEQIHIELASIGASGILYRVMRVGPEGSTVKPASPYAPAVADRAKFVQTRRVVRGDNLSTLTKKVYGKTNMNIVREVAKVNGIRNPDLIYPNQVIKFPKLD